ncbi:hypothetical protein PMIT1303_00339 [Prochlorococcus sp. MIT 1303]|nr:hypothetical protein PMIT1303_00339 [Prochlorococcus sp. MIT 1303]
MPPCQKPSQEEMNRWKESEQLSILPVLQPTPKELLQHQEVQKPKQVVKSKPTTNLSPIHKHGTLPLPTPTPKNSKKDLKKQMMEMKECLDKVRIQYAYRSLLSVLLFWR